jgi:Cu(I)/Ag(I) efflux system protein CusF
MPRRLFQRTFPWAALLAASLAWGQAPAVDGEVRKVDKAQQKITLKHGEIKHMDMPPMTMVFRVQEARLLDSVAEGDKVRFTVEKINGQYTITSLSK